MKLESKLRKVLVARCTFDLNDRLEPIEPTILEAKIRRGLEIICSEKVEFAVFPELSFLPTLQDEYIKVSNDAKCVIFGGSYIDDQNRNSGPIFLPGGQIINALKSSITPEEQRAGVVGTPSTSSIFDPFGDSKALSCLICKDFLHYGRALSGETNLRLIAVPAFSDDIAEMFTSAHQLAVVDNIITLFASGERSTDSAIFIAAHREKLKGLVKQGLRSDSDAPGLLAKTKAEGFLLAELNVDLPILFVNQVSTTSGVPTVGSIVFIPI